MQPIRRVAAFALRHSTLLRALRGDPLLALLTLLLAVSAILPLFVCRFLPFADLPDNVGAASLLVPTAFGHGVVSKLYFVSFRVMPYWVTYIIMAAVAGVFGVIVASKFIVGLLLVMLPLVTMRLLIALRRDPRLGLWAFAVSWEHNLYFGWVSFLMGMSLALLAIAWLLELEKPRDIPRIFVLSALVGLSHVEAVAFLGIAVILLLLSSPRPFVRSVALACAGASGTLAVIVPWLGAQIRFGDGAPAPVFSFDWHTPSYKMSKLAEYTFDNIPTPMGQWVTASVFLVLLLGPVFLASLPQHGSVLPTRKRAWVVSVAAGLLYITLPMAVGGPVGHWYTYPRYAPFLVLGLLLLPRPRLDGRFAFALVPGIAAALVGHAAITTQMAAFGKESAPFQEIIDNIRPDSTVLPLTFNDWHPSFTGFMPFAQLHAYIAGTKQVYDPLLFDYGSIPLQYNDDTRLPRVDWDRPFDYSWEKQGHLYDYILVQGAKRDPIRVGPMSHDLTIRKVVTAGIWTLYAVDPTPR